MIKHFPVMLDEVISSIPSNPKIIVDGTLGHGGHTSMILEKFSSVKKIYGFDLDPNILSDTKNRLQEYSKKINFVGRSYTQISNIFSGECADFVLLDLGVNMEHFKDGSRGFSINHDSLLDMRFDNKDGKSAFDIINKYSLEELKKIFLEYAEFTPQKSTEISQEIIKQRKLGDIKTTFQLKHILNQLGLGQKASTVIFQAIRIETNKEIDNLKIALEQIPEILCKGGRFGIITFHSIEDRLVKQSFKKLVESNNFKLLQKKVIKPHYKEVEKNRASRSAKYRVLEKI